MKKALFLIIYFTSTLVVCAQTKTSDGEAAPDSTGKVKSLMDSVRRVKVTDPKNAARKEVNGLKKDLKEEGTLLKTEISKQAESNSSALKKINPQKGVANVVQQAPDSTQVVGDIRQSTNEAVSGSKEDVQREAEELKKLPSVLREKAETELSDIEYNSEDPENAPWKKLSKEKLPDLREPDLSKKDIPAKDLNHAKPDLSTPEDPTRALNHKELSGDFKSAPDQLAGKLKQNRLEKYTDSLRTIKDKIDLDKMKGTLTGARKIYSEKTLSKLYDSLGATKADSLLKVVSTAGKKDTSKEDMLATINERIAGKAPGGLDFDQKSGSLTGGAIDSLSAGDPKRWMQNDLSALKLPDSVLNQLPPLGGKQIDSKFRSYIDSVRKVTMKAKGMSMDEEQLTENLKRVATKKKPSFFDKLYFDGLISFSSDSAFQILQISPSLGYYITERISIGGGPNILVELQERKVNALGGLRAFVKGDVWKQRAYLQLEDNMRKTQLDKEAMKKSVHEVMFGAGFLFPILKKTALNVCVLYKINQVHPDGSPWVFRVGLSSIKKLK